MAFNPNIHHRQSIRLDNYDYSARGWYFVTLCEYNRHRHRFGKIIDDKMHLSFWGEIVEEAWLMLPERFNQIVLDEFKVMPNHFHGLFAITERRKDVCVGDIVGALKSVSANYMLERFKEEHPPEVIMGKVWQRNFYDEIIRDARHLDNVRQYIINNPRNWTNDEHHCSQDTDL
jgi:putative transposase